MLYVLYGHVSVEIVERILCVNKRRMASVGHFFCTTPFSYQHSNLLNTYVSALLVDGGKVLDLISYTGSIQTSGFRLVKWWNLFVHA